jgi:hypothetical protein
MNGYGPAQVVGTCWEALTTDYPTCSGYESDGYTCVGDFCSAIDPGGTPSDCAQQMPAGSMVDKTTGRCVQEGSCSSSCPSVDKCDGGCRCTS